MYCRPGLEGAHEKGGVEGQIYWFRRDHLVPVPEVGSLAELNAMVERWDEEDDDRRIRSRPRTIGEYFAVERPLPQPLPTSRSRPAGCSARGWTDTAGQCPHEPLLGAGGTDRPHRSGDAARLRSRGLRRSHGSRPARAADRQGPDRLEPDHYLESLVREPGAFPGATALEQARSAGRFTPVHEPWWAAACKVHGDRDGTGALIEVLLLGRHLHHEYPDLGSDFRPRIPAVGSK